MQKKVVNILIADDEPRIRKAMRSIFEQESFNVSEACDGYECLVSVKKNSYDVIFLDIKMPKIDGVEVLSQIKLMGCTTPVIMICGFANEYLVNHCLELGAFDFLHKPFDLYKVLSALTSALAV